MPAGLQELLELSTRTVGFKDTKTLERPSALACLDSLAKVIHGFVLILYAQFEACEHFVFLRETDTFVIQIKVTLLGTVTPTFNPSPGGGESRPATQGDPDATGNHQIKQNKSDDEKQMLHAFFHS